MNETQVRSDLGQLADDLARMKDRAYRSPDEAYAALIATQTRLNYAFRKLGDAPTSYQMLVAEFPKVIESVIGMFIERARAVAAEFSASVILSRASAMEFWSFRWVEVAMSATMKSMRPSLFTSPRSDPIE